ncbi:MAG: hypothetical protein WCO63_12040 [Bacteroidota bacterium]
MDDIIILGVYVSEPIQDVPRMQEILTKYGCVIKTRLGLHEVVNTYAEPMGLVILELYGDRNECTRLENELLTFDGLEIQKMTFKKKSKPRNQV